MDQEFLRNIKNGQQPNLYFHFLQKDKIDTQIIEHIKNWQNYQLKSNKIKQFYRDLEWDHSFIQWIFPNFYNSMINGNSQRLSIEERNNMIININNKDKQDGVMDFYFKNYKMFLKFLGIKWNYGKLEFEEEDQFKLCLYTNTHNQLRLQRIFASLSVLGYREEAIKLLDFIYQHANDLYLTQYYRYDLVKEEEVRHDLAKEEEQSYDFVKEEEQNQQSQNQRIDQSKIEQDQSKKQEKNIQQSSNQMNSQSSKTNTKPQQQQQQNQLQQKDEKKIENVKKEQKSKDNPNPTAKISQTKIQEKKNGNLIQPLSQRSKYKYSFEEVKNQYVQGDLVYKSWVTFKLLTREQIKISNQQ